ncbi:MAG: ATP-binding protein [Fulvivirga sp.]
MEEHQNMELLMRFDPRTIEHLGIQMYSTLPPVIAELISNAYDADANMVAIHLFDDGNKEIRVEDDGHGMSFSEINDKFLLIGRNRRVTEDSQKSESGKRYVIGKKGLGKLAFFGIAEHIRIETIRNYKQTTFELDWNDIRKINESENPNIPNKPYAPRLVEKEVKVNKKQGTKMVLSRIKRKSEFSPEHLAISLAKAFQIFNESDFEVKIYHNSEANPINVVNELRYKNIDISFQWNFPKNLEPKIKYQFADVIEGTLISAKDTVPSDMRGIALFSRGKLVNNYNFLDVKATSHGYSYITGWLDVDFIEEFERDVISTNRQSLNWELEETSELKNYLELVYRAFFNEQKEDKRKQKEEEVKKLTGVDLEEWLSSLPKHESKLAKKMSDSILNADGIDVSKAGELIKYTRDSFQFEAFKELASELEEASLESTDKIVDLFKEWQIIEAKEFYKIAQVRIETIKKFESHIENNSREVPEIHNFLKKFPWILDPRIMNFEDEVTYSKLLRENFKDDDIDENKRIDFLCVNFAESHFIIELKRPETVIGTKQLDQALEYVSFIQERLGNEYGVNVYCYIIGKKLADTTVARKKAEAYKNNNDVYFKPYTELLTNAKKYHQEFIEKYDEIAK